jgi:hypothetical protein
LLQCPLIARLPAHQQLAHRLRMLLIHSRLQPLRSDVTIAPRCHQVNAKDPPRSREAVFFPITKNF